MAHEATAAQRAAVEKILSEFNFARVAMFMREVGWTYYGEGVPNEPMLKDIARQLLEKLVSGGKIDSVKSGGFEARRVREEGPYEDYELIFCAVTASAGVAP